MILTLKVPYIDRSAGRGRIARWHKSEGDTVDYGDELFDFRVEDITRLVNPGSAGVRRPGDGPPKSTIARWNGATFVVRVVASDAGILRQVRVAEGQTADIGDVVALLSTDEREPLDGDGIDIADRLSFRVVPEIMDAIDGDG